jgi:preprotein translocase subunit SecD
MARQRGIGWGRGLVLACACLVAASPAQGQDEGPVAAFRRAVAIHRSLQCGSQPFQGISVRYRVEPRRGQPVAEARARMVEVLRRRAEIRDRDGPVILSRGVDEIEIWYPGGPTNAMAMKGILERPGVLEFHAVDTRSPWFDAAPPAVQRWAEARQHSTVTQERRGDEVVLRADSREELEAFVATLPEPPPARILAFEEEDVWDRGIERRTRWRLFLLHADAPVHGGHLASATATTNDYDGAPIVALAFTDAGATAFADLTEALTKQLLAIVLDGQVMSAPMVQERIAGGRAQITLGSGRSHQDLFGEARSLATVLRSGGHPAGLVCLSQEIAERAALDGWRALGPLPFTAQAIALIITLRYGCF